MVSKKKMTKKKKKKRTDRDREEKPIERQGEILKEKDTE